MSHLKISQTHRYDIAGGHGGQHFRRAHHHVPARLHDEGQTPDRVERLNLQWSGARIQQGLRVRRDQV